MAAHGLADVLDLGRAVAELDRVVAVAVLTAHRDDMAVVDLEHGDGHVYPVRGEGPRHAEFLSE